MKLKELIYEESLLTKAKRVAKTKITKSFDKDYSSIIKRYYSNLPSILQQEFDLHMEEWKKKNLNTNKSLLLYTWLRNEYSEEALRKISELYENHLKNKIPETFKRKYGGD